MRDSRKNRGERGAAVVELAFVLPILLLLLFGLIEFGRGYNAKIELTSAVREGARAAALGKDPATIASTTKAAAPGLNASSITVASVPCTSAGIIDGTVTVTYPFTYDILFFGRRTVTLTAKGVMRCGA